MAFFGVYLTITVAVPYVNPTRFPIILPAVLSNADILNTPQRYSAEGTGQIHLSVKLIKEQLGRQAPRGGCFTDESASAGILQIPFRIV